MKLINLYLNIWLTAAPTTFAWWSSPPKKNVLHRWEHGVSQQSKLVNIRNDGVQLVSDRWPRQRIPDVSDLDRDRVHSWLTARDPDPETRKFRRFEYSSSESPIQEEDASEIKLTINYSDAKQAVLGFGGAMTDAVAKNLAELPSGLAEEAMKLYFGPGSADYDLVRFPVGSCDFSERVYSYNNHSGDYEMKNWALQPEDAGKLKWLNWMKVQGVLTGREVDFMTASWAPPLWMKETKHAIGSGRAGKAGGLSKLIGTAGDKNHKAWALYLRKFLDAYKSHGVDITYLSPQNEPQNGNTVPAFWNSLGWSYDHMRDFIQMDLGPELHENGHADVKVIINDDVRYFMRDMAKVVLASEKNQKYVSGVGIHWYRNSPRNPLSRPGTVTLLHKEHPDKLIMATEACHEESPQKEKSTRNEQWNRGAMYSADIIQNLNNWAQSWIDWNLVLDTDGGPNWAENFVDAPVLADLTKQEILVQPMYFHMLHFSKLIPRGSVAIGHKLNLGWSWGVPEILSSVVRRPDGGILVTVLNNSDENKVIVVDGRSDRVMVPANSIKSVLFYDLD